jgi:hypothetical protein
MSLYVMLVVNNDAPPYILECLLLRYNNHGHFEKELNCILNCF